MGKTSIEWTEYSWNPIRARRKHDGHTLKAGNMAEWPEDLRVRQLP